MVKHKLNKRFHSIIIVNVSYANEKQIVLPLVISFHIHRCQRKKRTAKRNTVYLVILFLYICIHKYILRGDSDLIIGSDKIIKPYDISQYVFAKIIRKNMSATITSIAHYLPPTVINNAYFEKYLDTTEEWILKRTGIHERRFLLEGATSDLIVPAAKKCLEKRRLRPKDVDCIIVCTVTPDYQFPNTACVVQNKLGCKHAWGFDISAACSGFVFGLATAASFVNSGLAQRVLLCGADKMTSVLNLNDRNQAVLFGDGAGVCLIEKSDDPNLGIIEHVLHIDGSGGQHLMKVAGGSFLPAWDSKVKPEEHYIYQEGQVVFKNAVTEMTNATYDLLKKTKLNKKDITWFVPHQANLRIIKAVGDKLDLPPEKVVITIDKFANTTAATIPTAMSQLWEERKLRKGDNIMIASFGAGFTWGASLIKWNPYEE